MSKRTKFFITLGAVFLVVGVPIIINECYKANCGYKLYGMVRMCWGIMEQYWVQRLPYFQLS